MFLRGRSLKYHKNHTESLDTTALKDGLKKRSIRGGMYTMAGEGITFVLRLGCIVVLARILVPEQFGLISMVMALTVIAERFKDLGLSLATIQKKDITHEQISSLFWINVMSGAAIMMILCMLSKLIAWFYGDDRLVWITVGISSTFLFGGMTVQHQALLRREMQFLKIAAVNVAATIVSVFIAIMLAAVGYEYWALMWREIARSVFFAVGTWLAFPWIPGLSIRNANIGEMVRFGRDVTGFNVVNFIAQSFDQILIGKFWGPSILGIYRQAYQLILGPVGQLSFPVQYVAEPALSLLQNDPFTYRQYYKKIVTLLSVVSMPLAVLLFLNSKDIILVLLGEKWIEAAEIFRILAVGAFILPVASTTGFVMVTCGQTKKFFFLGLAGSIIFVLAFIIGIRWGAVGIALGYIIATYIYVPPLLVIGFRNTPVNAELFLSAISPSVICSLLMGAAVFLFSGIISFQTSFASIAGSLAIGLIVYGLVWILIPGGSMKLKGILADFWFTFRKAEKP